MQNVEICYWTALSSPLNHLGFLSIYLPIHALVRNQPSEMTFLFPPPPTKGVVYNCFLRRLVLQRHTNVMSFCMQFEKRGCGLLWKALQSEGELFAG